MAFGVMSNERAVDCLVPLEDLSALAPVDIDVQRIGEGALVHRLPAGRFEDAEKAVDLRRQLVLLALDQCNASGVQQAE